MALPNQIEQNDLHVLYEIMDQLNYEASWKRLVDNPDDVDGDVLEFIEEVRSHMKERYP